MSQDAIIADRLKYHYGSVKAVQSIGFRVGEGEIMGFLGPNGAGKTTTVKILTGQLRPQGGHAMLLGTDVSKNPGKVQARIGVSFESTNLYEQMSAEENLRLFASLFGVRRFDPGKLLKRVGLAGREKERVEGYSKGLKQRLMVARALVNQPRILFLDEPTDGLDPVSAETIRNVILEERERGATVFLTTHDMAEADKLSDRVAFINEGKIVALDTPRTLKQHYGRRALRAEVAAPDGGLKTLEITMDRPETPGAIERLFRQNRVITIHSEEASLEDIFVQVTGRGLF